MVAKLLINSGVVTLIFITVTTGPYLGISQITTVSSLLLVIAVIHYIVLGNKLFIYQKDKAEIQYIVVILVITLFQISILNISNIASLINVWLLPMIILLFFKRISWKYKNNVNKIVVVFFILECLLALYERVNLIKIFPSVNSDDIELATDTAEWQFRSTAFWGHPLLNANIISIILAFILMSNYRVYFKIFCYILAILALFSFNSRGAIIIWGLITPILIINAYKELSRRSEKTTYLFLLIIFILMFFYFINNTSYGGRIFNDDKILDGSAMVRLKAYDIFDTISLEQFLIGGISKEAFTENGYINLCLQYGFILGLMLIIFQLRVIFKSMNNYTKEARYFILVSYLGVGSLNNNLSSTSLFLFFAICVSNFCLNKKYVTKSYNLHDFSYNTTLQ